MQSKATTVKQYLSELPADRREAIEKVRAVINANLDKGIEEGMSYGMIGYSIPHSIYPAGYHCDPKMPLPYAALASQKGYMSLYLMCLYTSDAYATQDGNLRWFLEAYARTGKKLDMGKSCIRFKNVEDLSLDVIGEAIKRATVKTTLAAYESALVQIAQAKEARAGSKAVATKGGAKAGANGGAKVAKASKQAAAGTPKPKTSKATKAIKASVKKVGKTSGSATSKNAAKGNSGKKAAASRGGTRSSR